MGEGESPRVVGEKSQSKIQNLKSIDGGPHLRLRCEIKAAFLKEEAARVAQKSSCTAQSCYQQQWTANRQTDYASMEANGEF
ncbi:MULTISPECIES: hypothetical protein [unclassified Microcoleus]|uniref:hypothetical protein n=1 Tax=unclassified Microcoleus TaxID=2642155 RepID=UPI002FD11A5B